MSTSEVTTLQIPHDLVRTRGRGSVAEPSSPRPSLSDGGSRYHPGEVIADKYRLVRPIARGGMGEVWLATHESLKTDVAVKFSDAGIRSDPDRSAVVLERFLFEARISARLGARTKHIVAVLDAGTYSGVPYLVMEYVRGKTLDEELTEKTQIAADRMANVLDQVADALDVAHTLGVIHRDIKPANVMIVDDPSRVMVKVADFGVAKLVRPDLVLERPKATPVNALIGSPAYMSPEQMRSNGTPIDLRADLWSLGVLTYEALTGKLAFTGKNVADLIVAISTLPPIPLSKLRPELGTAFDAWFSRALAKDRTQRFGSAREMASTFRSCLAASARRQPRRLLLGGLVLAGVLAGAAAIVLLYSSSSSTSPTNTSPQRGEQTSDPTSHLAVAPSPPPSSGPRVEPFGPVTAAPSSKPHFPVEPPAATAPVAAPGTATAAAEPTASAEPSAAPSTKPATTSKPPKPPKEFDPSEIQ